jgi:arylsulfatase
MPQPNVLFVMTDQQRFDSIQALGNADIYTPNFDRLVRRGQAFTNAYSPCPVCVAARYTIRTGCLPPTTRVFSNGRTDPVEGQASTMTGRCGSYLPQVMRQRGYRTFGIGKFHTQPWEEDLGYEVYLRSEELYGSQQTRQGDDYAAFIAREHPHYDFIEGLMGERTEMYYMPQMSPMPAAATVESWAADRGIEQVQHDDGRPFFGMVSFVGPHPPLAPPIPFNRLYDPDRMPAPIEGDPVVDHLDEQIPWMNYAIWADDISVAQARALRARYYGELTYIDQCLGRLLDAVDARDDADNTLICLFSDHGDHMGDHRAWQKESFFDVSCRVPFLLSWPERLKQDQRREELVGLQDLFGIATAASGDAEIRDGIDVLAMLEGSADQREAIFCYYGPPGEPLFKVMVRRGAWKYIYMANGGRQQLFNVEQDPAEICQRLDDEPEIAAQLRRLAEIQLAKPETAAALEEDGGLRAFPFAARPLKRIYQFDRSRGVSGFPEHPRQVLDAWREKGL